MPGDELRIGEGIEGAVVLDPGHDRAFLGQPPRVDRRRDGQELGGCSVGGQGDVRCPPLGDDRIPPHPVGRPSPGDRGFGRGVGSARPLQAFRSDA